MITTINSAQTLITRYQSEQQPASKALSMPQNNCSTKNNDHNVSFKGRTEKIICASFFTGGGILNTIGKMIEHSMTATDVGPQVVEGLGIALMVGGILPILWKLITNKTMMIKEPVKGASTGLGIALAGAGLSMIPKFAHFSDMPYTIVGAGLLVAAIPFVAGSLYHLFKSMHDLRHTRD